MEQQLTAVKDPDFVDRRKRGADSDKAGFERRQFRDGNRSARPEVAEFADAIDEYKITHRRRFVTFEELFDVMSSLGYHR
jgi:hypothetical protein